VTIESRPRGYYQSSNLVDVLDRVLDKGLVVAGDIRISVGNIELLTVRIRLLVCSIDKAEQIGIAWWRYDRSLLGLAPPESESNMARLEKRIAQLERRAPRAAAPAARTSARSRPRNP
jgi:hypothetical protein